MLEFTFTISDECANLIKEKYGFIDDDQVRKQLNYWLELDIKEVVLKSIIEKHEVKDDSRRI